MRLLVVFSIVFLMSSSFFVCGLAKAQTSQRQLLDQINFLYDKSTETPYQQLETLKPIISKCEEINWELVCLNAYTLKIELLIETEDINEAQRSLKEVVNLANKFDNASLAIRLEVAELSIRDSKGLLQDITKKHASLIKKADLIETPKLAGWIYLAVGRSQYLFSDYTSSLLTLKKSYASYELANDIKSIGSVLNMLANVNLELGNVDIAREYFQKALITSRKSGDKFEISVVLYNIGNSYSLGDNIDKAREYMLQAMQMSVDLNDDIGVAWAKKKLADFDIKEGNWRSAITLYSEIQTVFEETGSVALQFQVLSGQAEAHLALSNLDIASQKADQSRLLLPRLNAPFFRENLYKTYANIAYAKGEFKQAFDILNENYAFAEKVHLEEKQKTIEKYRVQFDSELKEKENESLSNENESKNLEIREQTEHQKLWWLIAGLSILLSVIVGLLLFIQTKNRNHFKSMALKDHLTGSPNRRAILEYVESRFFEATRTAQSLIIGIIDLDDFKTLNDKHGHKTGDDVLVAFANACTKVLRQYDKFGRYGGEEWLIVFPDTSPDSISDIFVRIRDQFNQILKQHHPDFSVVTFSIGIATFNKDTDNTPQSLINRADRNLYKAKDLGKDQVCF
ncbi:MAG: diguanylate cyclase (GGDEF)-like protein [Arenicella sp.]|jgi:diguanylate cyclase (GGDEF)-like protein